jgi:hypothetical protein
LLTGWDAAFASAMSMAIVTLLSRRGRSDDRNEFTHNHDCSCCASRVKVHVSANFIPAELSNVNLLCFNASNVRFQCVSKGYGWSLSQASI